MFEGLGSPFMKAKKFKAIAQKRIATIIYKIAMIRGTCSIFLNAADKQELATKVRQRTLLAQHGIGLNLNQFSNEPMMDYKSRKFRILFVGRLIAEKGIYDVIALAKMFENDTRFEFKILGSVDVKDSSITLSEIEQLKSLKNIEFLGFCDPKSYYDTSHVLCFPSVYREGSPRVVMEAMARGTVVIAYDNPGIEGLLINDITGLIAEEPNIMHLATMLTTLADNRQYLKMLSSNAFRYAHENFSHENFALLIKSVVNNDLKNS
jgi:glycosyltransferase involved in cell wall biosynthesis